ncbi:MAG TPA: fatty acid desaturase, partial [Rubellimicrobium sp.]|nr:fatty acid desaturase [Rubellimicrobium sp.]
ARAWVAIHAVTILAAAAFQCWVPLLLVGPPRLCGARRHVMMGLLQHGGLADNVVDRRLNPRTAYMDPVSRFIYWTMN